MALAIGIRIAVQLEAIVRTQSEAQTGFSSRGARLLCPSDRLYIRAVRRRNSSLTRGRSASAALGSPASTALRKWVMSSDIALYRPAVRSIT